MEEGKNNYKTAAIILAIILFGIGGFWAYNSFFKASSSSTTTEQNCDDPDIKGNISAEGEKIYHMPGQMFYDKTIINESNGEKWFCTEDEAVDAGWRKSKK